MRRSSETPPIDTDEVLVAMLPYGMFTYTELSTPLVSVNGKSRPSFSKMCGLSSKSSRNWSEPAKGVKAIDVFKFVGILVTTFANWSNLTAN